jgi:hypothetical protein
MSKDRLQNPCIHSDGGCNCSTEGNSSLEGICLPSLRPQGRNVLLVNPFKTTKGDLDLTADDIRDQACGDYQHPLE